MSIKRRVVVVGLLVGWVLVLGALTRWSASTPAFVVAAAVTVLVGALIGRWWVPLVPAIPAAVWAAGILLFTSDEDYFDDSPVSAAFLVGTFGLMLAAGLLGGLVMRDALLWVVDRVRR